MAGNKIADFFAEIGIKVDAKKLEELDKKLDDLERGMHNLQTSANKAMKKVEKGFNVLSNSTRSVTKEDKSLANQVNKGNEALIRRAKIQKKIADINNKESRSSRQRNLESVFGGDGFLKWRQNLMQKRSPVFAKNATAWRNNFKNSVSSLTSASNLSNAEHKRRQAEYNKLFGAQPINGSNAKAWAGRFKDSVGGITERAGTLSASATKSRQAMYDNLFGSTAKAEAAAARIRQEIDRAHGKALKEYANREASAKREAATRENTERRIQAMTERTAAIREAGERRAAAIREAAEIRARNISNSISHSSAGRPSRGMMGGAAFGGALGSATSSIAGFLPGFGAAYAIMNANRVNQELQGQRLAMTAVMAGANPGVSNERAAALGAEKQEWLRNLANTVGFDFRQTQPAFTKMLASGTSAGMSVDGVQNIFQGVSEYGRVMGLDSESMKGSMRAIEQMMN